MKNMETTYSDIFPNPSEAFTYSISENSTEYFSAYELITHSIVDTVSGSYNKVNVAERKAIPIKSTPRVASASNKITISAKVTKSKSIASDRKSSHTFSNTVPTSKITDSESNTSSSKTSTTISSASASLNTDKNSVSETTIFTNATLNDKTLTELELSRAELTATTPDPNTTTLKSIKNSSYSTIASTNFITKSNLTTNFTSNEGTSNLRTTLAPPATSIVTRSPKKGSKRKFSTISTSTFVDQLEQDSTTIKTNSARSYKRNKTLNSTVSHVSTQRNINKSTYSEVPVDSTSVSTVSISQTEETNGAHQEKEKNEDSHLTKENEDTEEDHHGDHPGDHDEAHEEESPDDDHHGNGKDVNDDQRDQSDLKSDNTTEANGE